MTTEAVRRDVIALIDLIEDPTFSKLNTGDLYLLLPFSVELHCSRHQVQILPAGLTMVQRALLFLRPLIVECLNGGIDQYVWNHRARVTAAAQAFEHVGASGAAALLCHLLAELDAATTEDEGAVEGFLAFRGDVGGPFFDTPIDPIDDVEQAILRYGRAHPDEVARELPTATGLGIVTRLFSTSQAAVETVLWKREHIDDPGYDGLRAKGPRDLGVLLPFRLPPLWWHEPARAIPTFATDAQRAVLYLGALRAGASRDALGALFAAACERVGRPSPAARDTEAEISALESAILAHVLTHPEEYIALEVAL